MSDVDLRILEQRWRSTGAASDQAAWLVERVRRGDLSRSDANLAAYLAHQGAVRAFPESAKSVPVTKTEFVEWTNGLGEIDPGLRMRALGALFDRTWPEGRPHLNTGGDSTVAYFTLVFLELGWEECHAVVVEALLPAALDRSGFGD